MMTIETTGIQIGDTVVRIAEENLTYRDVGEVVEKNGDRCRVAWRNKQVPSFYRPEEMVTRPGKRTWVNQKSLKKV